MKAGSTIRKRKPEKGIALLISIFILLLISVVAIALIVSSGTESALAGNYRSSTSVYYAALSGLEEARGRLLPRNPDSFKNTAAGFMPAPGTPLAVGSPVYVINPFGSETVGPWDPSSTYPDTEFGAEFSSSGFAAPPNPSPSTLSVWNRSPLNGLNIPGPLYKWVRLNAVSEKSLNLDVDADGLADSITPLYYDGAHFSNSSSVGPQVLEITSLAVLPNGSQKLLQYLVVPAPITLPPFLAALTLSGSPGNSPVFQAPANNAFYAVKGNDLDCSGNPTVNTDAAIGLFGDYSGYSYASDLSGIVGGIPTNASGTNTQPNYTGLGAAPPTPNPPDVEYLTAFPASLWPPSQIDAFAQRIIQNADAVVPAGSNSTQTAYLTSLGMSPTNIMTVVANGDLDISNWSHDGYGLLLVTGTFTYDPNTTWNGIILVIGQGKVQGSLLQYKQINGAMFVAKTRDTSGILLTGRIGGASVTFNASMQGYGIRYSSCWINKAQSTASYKILSFHEISQ